MVIGLQSTGEAATDSLGLNPGDACGFVSTTRQLMLHFVNSHFPTTRASAEQPPPEGDAKGGEAGGGGAVSEETATWGGAASSDEASPSRAAARRRSGAGAAGKEEEAEEEPTSVQLKASILERIEALDLPPNPLDELIDRLGGPSNVAEMTGRKARVVRDARG